MSSTNFNEVQNQFYLVATIGPNFTKLVVILEKSTGQFEYNIWARQNYIYGAFTLHQLE